MNSALSKLDLMPELVTLLEKSPCVSVPKSKAELYEMVFGPDRADKFDVSYPVDGRIIKEADVVKCKNGAVVNYPEDYMRRRDADCMRIGDDKPTDKPRYKDVYGDDFAPVRRETFRWLGGQELVVIPFMAGGFEHGYGALLVCPKNAAFFAYGLAQMQGFLSIDECKPFAPRAVIYVAPPFRHTHFDGRQVVVHNRLDSCHEVFSYNLYPGPSAKKGVYSVLLDIGEAEGWLTAHASTVRVVTPYENETVIMHEGASGGGKSEMLEEIHRDHDGRVLLGVHTVTGEKNFLVMKDTCELEPLTDDMALCHPDFQNDSGKLVVTDAEDGWFLRMDNITHYGCDSQYENICIHPPEPLIFFNMQGIPGSTCLIWEHIIDSNGKPCPNPRVVVPRRSVKNIVMEPVEVDVRSFGVRMPPSSMEHPNYGIMGLLQIIPPSLAWLWRLVAPRGFNNPSIAGNSSKITSEGVGSYWPFATGKRVEQANLLLRQIVKAQNTRYVLIPNQHIGVYKIGFVSEWISREYLSRRGDARFRADQLVPARCPLMGYSLNEMKIDGQFVRRKFLRPETQDMLGQEGYDAGAKILTDFFTSELEKFDTPELDPLGREIIACFKNGGSVEDYCALTPMKK